MNDAIRSDPLADQVIESTHAAVQRIRAEIGKAVVGQEYAVRHTLIALLAAGHVLIEGVPGLGKTLLVRALAQSFSGTHARIQFTPDLMPADILGHMMYDLKSGEFALRRGPIFANLLLADEINRAPAKTQSALLEVMQENQVTIEGRALELPPPFMVLATQNPIEQEGTYPLPEAQLDRFLLKILIDYPNAEDELRLVSQVTGNNLGNRLDVSEVAVTTDSRSIVGLQEIVSRVTVDPRIYDYAVRIARRTRSWPGVAMGAGPRGGISLVRAGRARALLEGRGYVTPDDIKGVALPALRHRVILAPELEMEGQRVDAVLAAILDQVEAPRT